MTEHELALLAVGEVIVNVMAVEPALPSATVALEIVSVLVSSFVIVPVPVAPVTMLAAATGATGVTAPSVMEKVSFPSMIVSPVRLTVIV